MIFSKRSESEKNTTLPIRPILDAGLIVYARSYKNGTRTVTFEDPSVYLNPHDYTYFGKGDTFTAALQTALKNYHVRLPESQSYITKQSSLTIEMRENLESKADLWITKYSGVLRALAEEDGTIALSLEGFIDVKDTSSRMVLEGRGKSFYSALASALSEYQNNHSEVTKIKILQTA